MLLTNLANVTPDKLDGLGIAVPPALADASIALWRSSDKAKWHWVDERSHCKHLPGNSYGRRSREIVPEEVPALGFAISPHAVCSGCIDRIALSAPADAFISLVAELLRAQDWLQQGREAASNRRWSWMAFARWTTSRPLTGGNWDATLRQIRGKYWAETALALRGLIAKYHSDADAVTRSCIDGIAENPARSSHVERAIRMVETDSAAREESDRILNISGCRVRPDDLWGERRPYSQHAPWEVVASAWRSRQMDHSELILLDALCGFFDEQFPHVHDLAALGSCTHLTPEHEAGECLQSWAWRSAQAHRREIVGQWLSRLDLALDGISSTNRNPPADCTHLVAVPFWPPVLDGMEPVAYLAQFDVVAGPFAKRPNYYEAPSIAVLRVPEWAAEHAEQLRRPLRAVAIDNEDVQLVQLARAEGVAVVANEFGGRRKPSQLVKEIRATMGDYFHPYPEYQYIRRPLAPGAEPPQHFGRREPEAEWTYWSVQQALSRGAIFAYGTDDLELLHLAFTHNRWRPEITLTVELQTECPRHPEPGPHICEVDGHLSTMKPDGSLTFTPHELADPVAIPAAYIAGLTFR